jgi:STE24 endopeptidase
MMPVSFLIALVIAFGAELPQTAVPQADVGMSVLETFGGISLVAGLAFALGCWVALNVSHCGYATSSLRRRYALFVRLLAGFALVVYCCIIHVFGWSRLVRLNWGLNSLVLIDDLLVVFPFIMIQLLVWWGLYFAERALHHPLQAGPTSSLRRYMTLRTRQAFGLILPVILLYITKHDLIARFWPSWDDSPVAEAIEVAVLGGLILSVSPLFVRLAWPTRSLPDGALRARLERVAERAGFRFSDVLIWDTGNLMVNACVTGIWPNFRYVLLSDALVETLGPLEAAAVFGHEIGHVAHRHLLYFAFFFVGSLGVLSLLGEAIAHAAPLFEAVAWLTPWTPAALFETLELVALLCGLGLYFWLVFGQLSRRFERQADVFGSKVVSCDKPDCPPHVDLDADVVVAGAPIPSATHALCPVGIRIFADALASVARYNGIDPESRSWRHGSVASRIAFLEGLERHPERERRFQSGLKKLRLALAVVLGFAVVLSFVTHSWAILR